MEYTMEYASPLGKLLLASDGAALTGLWFEGQKHFARTLEAEHAPKSLPIFDEASRWLDVYFTGGRPDFTPTLAPKGTPFQQSVWRALLQVPYGGTTTYGELAARLGLSAGGARAVGGAVSRNPVSIIIPCHRVLGSAGQLTGYAGGVERKARLLRLEGGNKGR